MIYKFIDENIKKELISLRRFFHKKPEEGWSEFYTTYNIVQYLKKLNCNVYYGHNFLKPGERYGLCSDEYFDFCSKRAQKQGVPESFINEVTNGFTGAAAVFKFKNPGPVCVFRFDIDGLKVEESHNKDHKPYNLGFLSENEGFCHACGHDGHIAAGLALCSILSKESENLKGEIRVIFQPAEEGCRGASAVIESGFINGADYVFGGHIGISTVKTGECAVITGGFLATTKLDIVFKGKSAHAANSPHLGKNAMLAAAQFVLASSAIPRFGDKTTSVNTGIFNSGTGRNIIPDRAYLKTETRGSDSEADSYMQKEVIQRAKGAAEMYGCDVEINTAGKACSFASNLELVKMAKEIYADMTNGGILLEKSFTASEDFTNIAVYAEKNGAKCAYFTFGSNLAGPHHSSDFDFDETVLFNEAEFMARIAFDISKN